MRLARVVAVVAVAVVACTGCKRGNKPPARTHIWLGPSHACSLQKTADLECWGANDAGQLGDRTTTQRSLPAPVTNAGRPDQVALGAHHTCALSGGAVHCWGEGARGQLGTGLATPLSAPSIAAIRRGNSLGGVTALAAAGEQTCAVNEEGVMCWGNGVLEPVGLQFMERARPILAVGPNHVCAAVNNPTAVRCSGANTRGQSAGTLPILAGASILALTAGPQHTCALLEDGSVQCWGANDLGQLGDGTTLDSRVPALVSAMPPAVEIHAGANHTCARLRTNTVACWGDNRAHQLVNGTSKPSSKPLPVPGLVGVVELAVAGDSACARLTDGDVRCWGDNAAGQLGDGTTQPHDVPMPVKAAARGPAAATGKN